jgi:hypothetical protein
MTESEGRAPRKNPADTRPAEVDTAEPNSGVRRLAELKRRREASRRLPVLGSGRSDPWHYDEPQLTDHQLDSWLAAISHLAELGTPAIVPVCVRRALRRRAGA